MKPISATAAPRRLLPCCALLACVLAGCAYPPSALERALGDTVREARSQQAIPPAPPGRSTPTTDGVIAVHGVDRYQQTWIRPPAPLTVLNVQTGAAGATPAMPR